ncbi:MAG: hypothetical protein FRX49_00467 [Trebouxia sp. A1-2]|nr:MAG: hypothetical protein FRX49_00467 [Trebouxia sp. A1-2]
MGLSLPAAHIAGQREVLLIAWLGAVGACSFGKSELLLPEAVLLLRLLSESNSESVSCEDSRSPQLASHGWGSLASALRLGVMGATGSGEGLEAGRSGVSTKADSCEGAQLAALCPPAEPAKWRHQPLHSPQCQSKPAKKEDSAYKANSLAIVHASIAAADGLYLLSTQQAVGRDAKINKNMD